MEAPRTEQDAPGVSVVIPHYGDPALAAALVTQLQAQRGAPRLQLIVSDDASPTPFPPTRGVTVVRRSQNGGFGAAVNTGAERAVEPLLLILNSDLRLQPGFVADLVAAAAPHQPCIAGPAVFGEDWRPVASARAFPAVGHQAVEWLTPLARFRGTRWWQAGVGHDPAAVPGRTVAVDWLVGAALLLPTGVFADAGGFDDRFFMNSEEVDLQRRLRDRGVRAVYLGGVSAVHAGGGSSDPAVRRRWLVTARLVYAAKWGGLERLRAALTAATGVNLVVNCARRALGRGVRPLATAREELRLIWR